MLSRSKLAVFAMFLASAGLAADSSADLQEAARKGKTADVEALLARGADLEAKDKDGRTPLMLAAQFGRTNAVRLLLAKGAKPEAVDTRGWNAFMLALLAPAGGVFHKTHGAVLQLLPQPARVRLAVRAASVPGTALFSSCFLTPEQLTQHLRDVKPDVVVQDAFQRFAALSGRDLVAVVKSEEEATLDLQVEPGVTCVQQSDQLSLLIHARLFRAREPTPLLEKTFGGGVKTGMRGEMAANPAQYAPLFEAWAKSQAGPIYWAVVAALLQSSH